MSHDDLSAQINSFLAATNEVAKILGRSADEVRRALPDALGLEDQIEAMNLRLTSRQMVDALRSHSFSEPVFLCEVEFDESIIPDDVPRVLREATAKHKGEVWRVHQNDADPFPSSPHAHCLEQDLKLHLGSGELFRGRSVVGRLKEKDFLALRKKLGDKLPRVTFPPLH